ncbi:MAG: reverse transcriptase domain-containing protein [Planctomycetota bacterium]
MRRFSEYFSEELIIRELCKARVKLAAKRNDALFLHRISKDKPSANTKMSGAAASFLAMFPPRPQWHRFRPRKRGHRAAATLNLEALYRAVMALRRQQPQPAWARHLDQQVQRIRDRVLSKQQFKFVAPLVHAAVKNSKKHEYRPIALFGLEDKLIDGLTARYLRELLDPALLDSCLAFRTTHDGHRPRDIHYALEKILRINRRHRRTGVYVAECDIKGFFDCVSHDVAWRALSCLIEEAKKTNPRLRVHPRALEIFEAYLDAYSFSKNVRGPATVTLRKTDPHGVFKWHEPDLQQLHKATQLPAIGVPQGGALSCLIANAVLHEADKAMRRLRSRLRKSFTYLRYCDDMIILARDHGVCAQAFGRYQDVLKDLKLPAHPPKGITSYSKDFWDGKSNSPYRWHHPAGPDDVPWIQFVGYQVRYDGTVRVRLKSLKKQFKKLTALADQLLAALNPGRERPRQITPFAKGIRKNARQILHRFRQKLISQAVGRRRRGHDLNEPLPLCWANGFRGLVGKKIVLSHLKALDRHRERQVRRVMRRLQSLPPPATQTRSEAIEVLAFYGYPFSYYGQFKQRAKRE